MKKIMVLQHVPFEILGTLNCLFKEKNFRIRYINFGRHPNSQPTLQRYHALVILGGTISVNNISEHPHLNYEIELIQSAIAKGIPVLGICLGSQLIAKALGANVIKSPTTEIGWYKLQLTTEGINDKVFKHFGQEENIFQWHNESFTIPDNCKQLATSQGCANQAFVFNENVYGFQFHLEVDVPLINRWLEVNIHKSELDEHHEISIQKIRYDTNKFITKNMELSNKTFSEFIKLI